MSLLAILGVSAFAGSAVTTFASSFKAGVTFLITSGVIIGAVTVVTLVS